ncbi:DUF2007 domain-containing protein [Planktothrix agardhii]|jgi:hypothetical protein|uniref:Uncharacterized protein n=2 Tax=Planktothrix agardhii TaxID=1160 RepID=A0A073CQ70_PLAA1|nr:DUF2007 domain-containing protein [Planktothrix agardhii]MCF3607872.1 DUF2007 domain-containing protein [Planktothrix agardhii 1033]KEI66175.1 hypothetical protein A19Y_1063 [Planktothrix agardhii NIVA-CYA 126/8]MCB8751966.1 DUF2007 domain-containing protein [Planktothrix agardhii 1810]MCB8763177.1 DUF2007 domain-containing protein [Planktothrix agardhii 1809]MCB8776825.1 DUF2007 domain-containing protein [Planktothrix agardhii 1031]
MSWITIHTTALRWEAEFMQQVLEAQDIPTRVIDLGVSSSLGMGSPVGLQVPLAHRWEALLLLSPIDEELESVD